MEEAFRHWEERSDYLPNIWQITEEGRMYLTNKYDTLDIPVKGVPLRDLLLKITLIPTDRDLLVAVGMRKLGSTKESRSKDKELVLWKLRELEKKGFIERISPSDLVEW